MKKSKEPGTEKADEAGSFEGDLERLESIIGELERGDLPLEDAFARFEEGVRLSKSCRARLDRIEGRVAELLDSGATKSLTPDGATST